MEGQTEIPTPEEGDDKKNTIPAFFGEGGESNPKQLQKQKSRYLEEVEETTDEQRRSSSRGRTSMGELH